MVALFSYYNFCRVHSTLRATPATEAGISINQTQKPALQMAN
jgi:hypothetical protein